MLNKERINKFIFRAKQSYKNSTPAARREIGRILSGDIRSERKNLKIFK